ncbi:MAG TPA: MFS transporter [Burkholderiales bacterium]|nr:MFS transporter [Burkholderiales bacterium]
MSIYLITLLNVLNSIALRGSRVLMSLFAIQLGSGAFEIGILIAVSLVFQLFLGIYAGKVSDRYGFRLPILFGSLGSSLAMIVPYLYPDLTGLYASRALTGISFIFFAVAIQNLAASLGGPEMRARNLSTFSLGQSIAGLIAPVLIGFSIDHVGHARSYLFLGLLAMLPMLALFTFPHILPKTHGRKPKADRSSVLELLRIAPLRRTLLAGAIVFSGTDLLSFYVPIYGHSIGLSASAIGIILGAYAAAAFVVRVIMPALVGRWGEEKILTVSLVASGITYPLFPFFQNPWCLTLIAFLLGLGLGCGQPLSMMLTYNRSPDGRAGEVLGLRITVNKIIQIGVPLVFGLVGSAFGLMTVFWSNGVFLVAGGYLNQKSDGSASGEYSHSPAGSHDHADR